MFGPYAGFGVWGKGISLGSSHNRVTFIGSQRCRRLVRVILGSPSLEGILHDKHHIRRACFGIVFRSCRGSSVIAYGKYVEETWDIASLRGLVMLTQGLSGWYTSNYMLTVFCHPPNYSWTILVNSSWFPTNHFRFRIPSLTSTNERHAANTTSRACPATVLLRRIRR